MTGKTGICTLSYMPIRAEAAHRSEMVSMILFGELYHVHETKGNWFHIEMLYDNYKGWVDISSPFFIPGDIKVPDKETPILTLPSATAEFKSMPLNLSFGSSLPILLPSFSEEFTINANYNLPFSEFDFSRVFSMAEQFIGTPYLWGGRSIWGIDCSGFVQLLFKTCNIKLPRDAYQQAEAGKEVSSLQKSQAGDLAFFANDKGRIIHVGMIIPDNKIIHASYQVRIDAITDEGIINTETSKKSHNLTLIRRFVH